MHPTTKRRASKLKGQVSLFENRQQALNRRVRFLNLPGIDMFIKNGLLIIEVRLPGFEEDEVKVAATSESLEINALRKRRPLENTDKKYLMHESLQSFWRHLTLPLGTKWEELNYSVRNDRLTITIPMITDAISSNRGGRNYNLYPAAHPTKKPVPILLKDQEFPDHWSRYRPPGQSSCL